MTLLPEGIVRPGLLAPTLIPWHEITAVELVEVQMGRRQVPSLSIRMRVPQCILMSKASRWLTTNWDDPQAVGFNIAGYALPPDIIAAAIQYYAQGGGDTATIGTAAGLLHLHHALAIADYA
jgi:hypothetical protein